MTYNEKIKIVKVQRHVKGTYYVTIPSEFKNIAEENEYLECSRDKNTGGILYRSIKR
ncbi:hypothetical protein [Methanosarcina siciliae]|uniref:hypothetical protein n=1 Tax=Methanosarcina siciliae TaxID=38027 RepID=UPI0012E067E7|nr:hypothetical protein [Methanosarcina siciliae]